jgi:predicted transcriptional regulator of viral defense system
VWSGTVAVEIADIHRTLIDILDVPELGGGGRQMMDIVQAYWAEPAADARILLKMAERLQRGTVFKRLGFTTETFGRMDQRWSQACRQHMSEGVSLLDSAGPERGQIVSRWRIRINVPLPERR